jgi:hypothetical protein
MARIVAGVDLATVTASSFRALLRCIVVGAGLKAGQVCAFIPTLSRGQAYNLIKADCPSLPRYADQVRDVLRVCKLPPDDSDAVIALWHDLHCQARRPGHDNARRGGPDD